MLLTCLEGEASGYNLVGIDWYNGKSGYLEENCPQLAISYDIGCLQIMRDEFDEEPITLKLNMTIVSAKWSHKGDVIAVAGSQKSANQDKDVNIIQFYNPFGQHLRTLKVPGKEIKAVSWEGSSLRISLAVDSFIYFANIRPDYKVNVL